MNQQQQQQRQSSELFGSENITITPLGAGSEVGRSCIMLKIKGKNIMLDCGIHPAYSGLAALPFFDEIDPETVDLVLITHFHLDHAAGLPWFMEKTLFDGKVYMTHPTKAIYKWLLNDYVKVSNVASTTTALEDDNQQLYTEADLMRSYERITAIDYHQEIDFEGIKFIALNAGHVLGAAMFMVEVAGISCLYTGDYSREEDRHLMAAETPSTRPDVLICESTYGVHSHQPRNEREARFTQLVHEIVERGGRCLIPVFALGRAQELLLILDEYWQEHPALQSIPIYYASALAKRCMSVYQTYVNMMNERIRKQIAIKNPFIFKHISNLKSMEHFKDNGPCVMMASPAMLQSGLSRELFELWCPDPRNGIIIPGYVVEGTLAKVVLSEPKEITAQNGQTLPLKMTIEYISFSAHVDFGQNSEFIDTLRAPHLILVHGEAGEMQRLKGALAHKHGISDKTITSASWNIGHSSKDLSVPSKIINIHTPRNCESVDLVHRGERMVKIVGSLAKSISQKLSSSPPPDDSSCTAQESENPLIQAVLVGKDYDYQLMDLDDLPDYTQNITQLNIIERQRIKCRAPFTLIEYLLTLMFGGKDVKRVKIASEDSLLIKNEFSIVQESNNVCIDKAVSESNQHTSIYEYVVEWPGNPLNDIVADSIVMLMLGAESSRLSVKATLQEDTCQHEYTNSAADHPSHDSDDQHIDAKIKSNLEEKLKHRKLTNAQIQNIIKNYLESHFGLSTMSSEGDDWKFIVDENECVVGSTEFGIDCMDEELKERFTQSLHQITAILDPDYII